MAVLKVGLKGTVAPFALAGVVGVVAGLVLSPEEASKEFYSAAAGIIPVLLLTLGVQARFFELQRIQQVIIPPSALQRDPQESEIDHTMRLLEVFGQTTASMQRFIDSQVV